MMAGLDQVPLLPRDTAGGASGGRRTVPTADTGFFVFLRVWRQLELQHAWRESRVIIYLDTGHEV